MAVIAASVAVRWFIHGSGNEQAVSWLERPDLVAPDFILAEVGNALRRYVQRGHLEPEEASLILDRPPACFARLTPIGELVGDALLLANAHKHPVYDCCYLALAVRERTELVTLDRDLAAIAGRAGVPVKPPMA